MRSFRKKDEERDFDILVWKPHWSQNKKRQDPQKQVAPEKIQFCRTNMLDYPNK